MAEIDPSERAEVPIRSGTLTVLGAIAIVRKQDPWDVLDDIVEQARAKLWPDPKPPTANRARGGRRQQAQTPAEHQS